MEKKFKEYPEVNLSDFTNESSSIVKKTNDDADEILRDREMVLSTPLEEIGILKSTTINMLDKYFGCMFLSDLVNLDIERINRYDQGKNGKKLFTAKRLINLLDVLNLFHIPHTIKGPENSLYSTNTTKSMFRGKWEDNRETLTVLNKILELYRSKDELSTIRPTDGGYKNYYELTPYDAEGVSLKDFKKEYEATIQTNNANKAYNYLIKRLGEKNTYYIDEKGREHNKK